MDSASKGKGERKDRHRTRPGYWGAGHNIQVHLIRQKGKFWQTPDFLTENHKILKMWSTTDWLLLSICLNFSGFTHVFSMPSFLPQFASLTLKLIKLLDCYKKKKNLFCIMTKEEVPMLSGLFKCCLLYSFSSCGIQYILTRCLWFSLSVTHTFALHRSANSTRSDWSRLTQLCVDVCTML